MTLQSRFREQVIDLSYTFVHEGSITTGGSNITLYTETGTSNAWEWSSSSTVKPSLPSRIADVCGIPVTIAPPPLTAGTDGTWHVADIAAYSASVSSTVSSAVSLASLISWVKATYGDPSKSLTAVKADRYRSMTDVVGSGFTRSKGVIPIVNPCSSMSKNVNSSTSKIGTDTGSVTGSAVYTAGVPLRRVTLRMSFSISTATDVGLSQSDINHVISLLRSYSPSPDSFGHLFSDALSDIRDAEWEVLSTLVEARRTINYVTSRLSDVASIISKVRKLDFSFLKKPDLNSLADNWLEARYAVRPLIYDVSNALNAFGSDGRLRSFIRASKSDGSSSQNTLNYSFARNGITYTVSGSVLSFSTIRSGAYAILANDLPNIQTFGLLNFASAAWEAVPWSFIVDWFVNTSALISGLNPNPVYNVKNGYISVKTDTIFTGVVDCSNSSGATSFPISVSLATYERKQKITPDLINFNVDLNVPKLVDLLALAFRR